MTTTAKGTALVTGAPPASYTNQARNIIPYCWEMPMPQPDSDGLNQRSV